MNLVKKGQKRMFEGAQLIETIKKFEFLGISCLIVHLCNEKDLTSNKNLLINLFHYLNQNKLQLTSSI